ncbi:MAG TPA: NUDIX domain-containing protein [Streptosporangiaceae bacterium]|jgi:8-oxo-dGTP diphosphatase
MDGTEWVPPRVMVAVDLVILTLRDARLHLVLINRGVEPYRGALALPGGFLRHTEEDIGDAAHRELSEETDLDVGRLQLEHLGVYGEPGRDPRGRVISVAYLAIAPRLPEPLAGTDAAGARWYPVGEVLSGGRELAFDHRRIVADGVERARTKLERSALATAFCGPTFTIGELQEVYEAVWGIALDPRNFYRKVQKTDGFIVPAGPNRKATNGRPARLFAAGPRTVLHPPMVRPPAVPNGEDADMHPIVILTALDVEYAAVHAMLTGVRVHRHPHGTRFEVGRLADGRCRVALAQVGKGNQAAAILAERAVSTFDPAALLFVGVAGALHAHVGLGAVVVATHVYAFHGGTSGPDGFKLRPRVWETSHAADQLARHIERDGQWARGLDRRPDVLFGPIAAGEIVLNSTDSAEARRIRDGYNDALAVEMEGAGVAQAAHLNDTLPVVVVRGVSDRADGTKEATDREEWQRRAVEGAAAFAAALAESLYDEQGNARRQMKPDTTGDDDMPGTTRNIATGNAHVGAQVGTVYGGLRIGGEANGPGDVAEALAILRARLTEARAAGRLDDETYAAVETELAEADDALRDGRRQDGSRFVLAMKKVRGLIGDAADLAAAATAAITLARGLS